jgi:Flp pilus assembly protein TadB
MTLDLLAAVALVLGLSAGLAALIGGDQPPSDRRRTVPGWLQPHAERERRVAAAFGIRPRWWFLLRVAALAAVVLIGASTGLPVVILIAVLVGVPGVPWLLEGAVAARELRTARALVQTLRDLSQRLAHSGKPLDTVLRELSTQPRSEVARLLTPLVSAQSVDEAFAEAASTSGSPWVERVYLHVAACRARSRQTLVALLGDLLIPQLEAEIEEAEAVRVRRAGQRATVCVLAGVFFTLVWVLNAQMGLHEFYVTASGQLLVSVGVMVFAASAALMWAREEKPVRWDVLAARAELERLRRS